MRTEQRIAPKASSTYRRHARPAANETARIRHTTFRGFSAANALEVNRLPAKCAKTEKVKTRNEANLTQENYQAALNPVLLGIPEIPATPNENNELDFVLSASICVHLRLNCLFGILPTAIAPGGCRVFLR